MSARHGFTLACVALVCALGYLLSCGGGSKSAPLDLCDCSPSAPASADFRHAEKHIPLPNGTPQEISVTDMFGWPVDQSLLTPDAPRAGRELQLFHIATAYLQRVKLESFDCDVHFEISADPGKNSPRAIVELPVDSEYCLWRRSVQQQLAAHNVTIQTGAQELNPPLAVDVRGLAFQDAPHPGRGSALVATVWEIHPAIVQLH
jgi:hypothetical protein